LETTDKSGKVKLTVELEVNPALMELLKENMEHMMQMASQWRPGKGKWDDGGHGMGMMHHGQPPP